MCLKGELEWLKLATTYYNVRTAVKPKHYPNRFRVIGICCTLCEEDSKTLTFDKLKG